MLKYAILFVIFFGLSYNQVFDYHNCPNVDVVENFNLTAYLGTWYQFSGYWEYGQIGTKCNNVTYSLIANGSINVLDENVVTATLKHQKKKGIANLEGNGTEGKLDFTYPPSSGVQGERLILGTDYENWTVLWSCLGIDTVGSFRYLWLYTREANLSDEVVNATITVLNNYGISTDILMDSNMENCTNGN